MTEWMSEERRVGLRAICNTVVSAIERADDLIGYWARRATDVGADGRSSPLSAFLRAEIIDSVGLPAGVFNLVTGSGPVVDEARAPYPDVGINGGRSTRCSHSAATGNSAMDANWARMI